MTSELTPDKAASPVLTEHVRNDCMYHERPRADCPYCDACTACSASHNHNGPKP